jgi:hypothetical protein
MAFGLDASDSIAGGVRCLSSKGPGRLWSPLRLLSNGFRGIYIKEKIGSCLMLANHIHLLLRSKKVEL